jgi:sigma-E factor negative regulatory protein RseB
MLHRSVASAKTSCAALLLGALVLCAGWPGRVAAQVLGNAEARQWLARMHAAATQRNYQGTLVVTAEGAIASSRVAHYGEGGITLERVEFLDGQPRRVLRHNDQVLTLWPSARIARLEQREAVQSFPALLAANADQLFERYEMVAEANARVAGHEVAVFLLRPRDEMRFAQRLWAHRASHLLLRADVLAGDGRVLETSAFSDISIGGRTKPESVESALKQLDGWRVMRPAVSSTELEAEGWQLKAPVAGFRRASCVKRQLDATSDGGRSDVLQAIYTDGLTHVSLFIEPQRVDRQHAGAAAMGATHTWMQPLGTHWVTVMGDVPMATLKQFAAALEKKR